MAPTLGLLHPLVHSSFALIAGATLVSSIGVWMRDTTSAWTVASSEHGSASVALVQAATALPTFLLALPAGVLADHYDRRRILIWCQLALAAAGAALAVLSYLNMLSVGTIIGIAFVAGCAAALSGPAFQSIVPALVPPEDVRPAVALSSVSFNIARVIGPSIGGVLLATAGAAATYAFNAVAYLVTIGALLALPLNVCPNRTRAQVAFRAELHQGFAFVAQSSPFRRLLARASALYLCAACYLALTPAFAHDVLGKSPGIYGVLLSAVGIGSLIGAGVLSTAKKHGIADDNLLIACSAAAAVALALLAVALGIGITVVNNPFGAGVIRFSEPFSVGFTVFWIIGMINSINWIDGLDGLSSGIALIASVTLGLISLTTQVSQPLIAVLCFALAGSLAGFLRWNFHPAKIFSGTSGVQFVGFTLAVLAILGQAKVAVALLVLGVPIIDTFWIIVGRLVRGRSPFAPDRSHIHHRLLDLGLSHRNTVLLIYGICGALGVLAMLVSEVTQLYAFLGVFIVSGLILFGPTRGAFRRPEE
ncbi:MAG: MFS transporter, partial [Myxococcales bacterium]|nr:MFS transporter [Myxococcales bacterium]